MLLLRFSGWLVGVLGLARLLVSVIFLSVDVSKGPSLNVSLVVCLSCVILQLLRWSEWLTVKEPNLKSL